MGLGLLQRGRLGLIMPLGQLPKETPSNEPPDFAWGVQRKNKRVRKLEVEATKTIPAEVIVCAAKVTV